jgi:hypothetical protein
MTLLLTALLSVPVMAAPPGPVASASPAAAALTVKEWRDWAEAYLQTIPQEERVAGLEPFGSIAGERTAMANAQRLFRERLGRAVADAEQPYRAHRLRNLWVVVGGRQPPGEGLLLVLTRDAGAVVRLQLPTVKDADAG